MKRNLTILLIISVIICASLATCAISKSKKTSSKSSDSQSSASEESPSVTTDSLDEKQVSSVPQIEILTDGIDDTNIDDFENVGDDEEAEDISLIPSGDNSGKRVVCWGDSLTEGTGGEGVTMPNTLEKLSGAKVINYGGYGEDSSCIAARQGGNPQELVEDIVIPATCTPVRAQTSGNYGWDMLLVFSDVGINNVVLGGIEGTYGWYEDERCFTRLTPGEETPLPEGTQLFFHGMLDKKPDDILVIWCGSNDGIENPDEIGGLVKRINEMIAYQGNDKYIVVSLTSRHARIPLVDEINKSLSKEFGDHYLDFRSFIVNDALDQLGITPTDMDKKAIAIGDVPYSLRMSLDEEENHGNPDFYRLAGEQVYKKLKSLGYLY